MKTCTILLLLSMFLTLWSCMENRIPITNEELIGRYDVRMDSSALSGKGAKDAAMFAMLNFEYVFHENRSYEYNHHLGGMMKQVIGQWHLSNDSLYTTDENNQEYRIHFVIQEKDKNGFAVKKNDRSIIHLVRK